MEEKETFSLAQKELSENVFEQKISGDCNDTGYRKNSSAHSNKQEIATVRHRDNGPKKYPVFLFSSQQSPRGNENSMAHYDETFDEGTNFSLAQKELVKNTLKIKVSKHCDDIFLVNSDALSSKQEIMTCGDLYSKADCIFLPQENTNAKENTNTQDGEKKLVNEAGYNPSHESLHSVSVSFSESSANSNRTICSSSLRFVQSKIEEYNKVCLNCKGDDEVDELLCLNCVTSEKHDSKSDSKQCSSETKFEKKWSRSGTLTLRDNMEAKDVTLLDRNSGDLNHSLIEAVLDDKKNFNDPFDLFSDDDTEPKKYQHIKRKLTQTILASDQNNCHSTLESVDTMLPLTVETVDCKKLKLTGRVSYVHSDELLQKVNCLTRIEGRADLVHSLIQAYGLLQYVDVIPPRIATEAEILGFHSSDYIDFLRGVSTANDEEEGMGDPSKLFSEAEAFGLSYDCPLQDGIFETASLISGASVVAADTLIRGQADMAINWYGGWHHAKRDSASGFCYINDIVLAILKLREKFDKVLYVDIDLHHGDGVEEAFSLTSKVMTVSFHKYASGFFPGSGAVNNVGLNRGKFYAVNVPLQDGIKDAEFCSVFFRVMKVVKEKFSPEAVVLQCGADGLSEDHMASFNLTHVGLAKCVCFMLTWNLPTLLLGGGGYNFASTSKCWTFLTALVARRKLPVEIPEHENLLAYGPDYQMSTTVGNRRDCNSKQYLLNLIAKISRNLENI